MAFTFSKPFFTKVVSQTTGVAEPCYTFSVSAKTPLSALFESEESMSPVVHLTRHLLVEQGSWLDAFLTEFLKNSAKYFAKPFTPEALRSRLSHEVQEQGPLSACVQVAYTPIRLVIFQGLFTVTWSVTQEAGLISIPDSPSPAPLVAAKPLWVKTPAQFTSSGNVIVEDDEVDAIPLADSSDVVTFQKNEKENTRVDKRRVQEAALRAKLALLKAERTHAEYIQKYGQEASDESDSDETHTETESEDSD
jgi:hypothetical protein